MSGDKGRKSESEVIDIRFAPYPQSVRVPLHPVQRSLSLRIRAFLSGGNNTIPLKQFVSEFYDTDCEKIHLGRRAADLLSFFLSAIGKKKNSTPLMVATPSFCCYQLTDAILSARMIPVFYELDDTLSLNESSARNLVKLKVDVAIVPSLFGSRRLNFGAINTLKQAGITVLSDEVHSFPAQSPSKELRASQLIDAVLLSFNYSKRIPGTGGGALVVMNDSFQKALIEYEEDTPNEPRNSRAQDYFHRCIGVSKRILLDWARPARKYFESIGLASRPAIDFEGMRSRKVDFNCRLRPMREFDIDCFVSQLAKRDEFERSLTENFEIIKEVILDTLGPRALEFFQGMQGAPTICILRVPSHLRFQMGEFFSRHGIETLWIYYPLHLYSLRTKFIEAEDLGATVRRSSESFCLPITAMHTRSQILYISHVLRKFIATPVGKEVCSSYAKLPDGNREKLAS